jgi:hypothetical protein
MKALIRSPLMRKMTHAPRTLAVAPQRHPNLHRDPSPMMDQFGKPAHPAKETKWKRVGVRIFHQSVRAAEASGMAATLGYMYGRWGDPDGKSILTKVPLDLVAGFAFEIGAAWTENDEAAQHLEAFALGALSLHAGAWGRARGHDDRTTAEGRASAGGLLGEVGARSPERGTASLSEEELARLVTRT